MRFIAGQVRVAERESARLQGDTCGIWVKAGGISSLGVLFYGCARADFMGPTLRVSIVIAKEIGLSGGKAGLF